MRICRRLFAPFVLLSVLGALLCAPAMANGRPGHHGRQHVRLTPIGKPGWQPVDFNLFSAPIGTAASGYAEFTATTLAILPEPNHRAHPQLGVGPGAPHLPPYDREIRDGVRALGFDQRGPFSLPEFSNGNGVWLAWMNVPRRGTRGSSPDFKRGPIIPNALFPIVVSGSSTVDGIDFSTIADAINVPKLDGALDPPFNVDGHSHFPIFLADNADFGAPGVDPVGRFVWHIEMRDQRGDGWRIELRFVVRR
jgi:hypothetical protein